jgi:hypothetical protein
MITEPACWLPSFLILYIIQYWQQKLGDYIKDIFLQENNCNKNKVFSRCRTSNSSLPLDTEKPSSISVGKFSRHDGLREGYCFQNSCSILINYMHIKFWLSSNRKYCNPREERESAWCGCWQGTEQGSCRELQCPRNTGSIQLPASFGRWRRHMWAGAREGEGHQAAIATQNVEAEQDRDSADARENNGDQGRVVQGQYRVRGEWGRWQGERSRGDWWLPESRGPYRIRGGDKGNMMIRRQVQISWCVINKI